MVLKLRYVQLDVFTTTRFLGNPLAIVHLPKDVNVSQSQKQIVAREFNLSETVFLHEPSDLDSPVTIDIFTTDKELPFAGHPTIGSGQYLLSQAPERSMITLKTKAGEIPVLRDSQRVVLQVPIKFKVHTPYKHPSLKGHQFKLKEHDYVNGIDGGEALASIVKGMSFILLQLTSEDALAALQPYREPFHSNDLGEWAGFVGVYAFFEREDGVVRTRMFEGSLEDPATGSAASTLGGWLGKRKGPGKWAIEIVQGVEMGRKSDITVIVEVGADGEVSRIDLGGSAVEVIEGWITVE
jgi:PhzF family phenazine biosynthesis protein